MAGRPPPSSAAAGGAQVTISATCLTGRVYAVQVSLDDDVMVLKEKLAEVDCSHTDLIRLIFAGKVLEHGRRLRSYGLTDGSMTYMIHRLRGGGAPPADLLPDYDLPTAAAESEEKTQLFLSSSPYKAETEERTRRARAVAAFRFPALVKKKCAKCVGEALPEVSPEIVPGQGQNKTIYRAHLLRAGSFYCSETGLGFEVKAAVTIEYEYGSWTESLSPSARQDWMIAGPLFHIRAEPGAVQAVHLPHFVCLADGEDFSSCQIAHFEAGQMTLVNPTGIHLFHVLLANPNFSQLGVLWRKLRSSAKFIPIHSLVLIYHALSAADFTLHLYLIPNDHSLRKAIEEEELKHKSKLVPKPPQTRALHFGCQYEVSGTSELTIIPDHLELCYRSPAEQHSYIELYMRDMEEELKLHMKDRKDGQVVWETFVRPGDVKVPASSSNTTTGRGMSFVKKHREQLRHRMGMIYPILARLRDTEAMNSEEEEEVLSKQGRQLMNEALLRLAERKGAQAQEELYYALRDTDPFLVQDLEQSC